MRATAVGTTITAGQLNFRAYILSKYDGLIPDNYPTREQYKAAVEGTRANDDYTRFAANRIKRRYDRRISAFQREWVRQQRGNS